MTRVDLITGFLGAGKTTFIRRYLAHLGSEKVLVIENEFGSIGVDAGFLKDAPCDIDDLSGVCMCCRGKDRFRQMLIDAARHGYDRVLVEPSGIYDVDEFFAVMDDPAVAAGCAIGSVLAVVDARVPERLSGESADLMFSQLAAAGRVVLSKAQRETPEGIAATVAWMNALVADRGGNRRFGPRDVCAKPWDDLTEEDFEAFSACGCRREAHPRRGGSHEEVYGTAMVAARCRDEADLAARLDALMDEARCGLVIRAKGYARAADGTLYAVNCTRESRAIERSDARRGVLVVVGQRLDEDGIRRVFSPDVL